MSTALGRPLRLGKADAGLIADIQGKRVLALTVLPLRGRANNLHPFLDALARHCHLETIGAEPDELQIFRAEVPDESDVWIRAGQLFEEVLRRVASAQPPGVILCLDPWAGNILGVSSALPGVKWVYILSAIVSSGSDANRYYDDLNQWCLRLPFDYVGPADALLEIASIHHAVSPVMPNEVCLSFPSAYPEGVADPYHGRIQPVGADLTNRNQCSLDYEIVVDYPGDLSVFRVFLDSFASQAYPPDRLRLHIHATPLPEDLARYLRAFRLAHPRLAIQCFLSDDLSALVAPYTVRTRGDVILPRNLFDLFSAGQAQVNRWSFSEILLDGSVSAHIVIGNLDPAPHYEALIKAHEERVSIQSRDGGTLLIRTSELQGKGFSFLQSLNSPTGNESKEGRARLLRLGIV